MGLTPLKIPRYCRGAQTSLEHHLKSTSSKNQSVCRFAEYSRLTIVILCFVRFLRAPTKDQSSSIKSSSRIDQFKVEGRLHLQSELTKLYDLRLMKVREIDLGFLASQGRDQVRESSLLEITDPLYPFLSDFIHPSTPDQSPNHQHIP